MQRKTVLHETKQRILQQHQQQKLKHYARDHKKEIKVKRLLEKETKRKKPRDD